MARSDALRGPPVTERGTRSGRADNPLVRVVARIPWRVRTKLLVAFVGIVALIVVVGALGLRALGQSNARVERLGTLQLRAATYQRIQTQAQQLRQLLGLRAGANNPNFNTYNGGNAVRVPGGRSWTLVDQTIATALSQVAPATNETRFRFVPPPEDEALLERIRLDYGRFARALKTIIANDKAGAPAKTNQPILADSVNADNDLGALTDKLATTTRAQTDALIAQNRSAYAASRNLFIAVGAGSVVLALLLGFVLSWSVTEPLQRTDERLAEIASGDFSKHLKVPNRDELGALAANLNRMSDELGRLYEELEAVSRHKSEFLANMSHELRTPLNAIIGFSEVLQRQMFGELNEQQLGYVDDVLDAGRHLLSLINDILDLSKVEAGRMELDLADVSVPEALRSGLTMHGERASRAGITLGLTVEPDEILIQADERKLRQVVFNLLSNAVKFTPPGGRVDVSAQMSDGVVEVTVADTGSGIAADDQELIFEEFGQARGDRGSGHQGTGLGLPLSRKFIELHGGRLWVESGAGAGSTFRFTLPVRQAE
ncbi:MAG: HAMP domain-containing protein [Actinobacteria bacterium]|nr:MAG: HAMP domain-containing protein [Actinomycetota bacterium]